MASYQAFIANSRGEFTVAKDIYVRPNSGCIAQTKRKTKGE